MQIQLYFYQQYIYRIKYQFPTQNKTNYLRLYFNPQPMNLNEFDHINIIMLGPNIIVDFSLRTNLRLSLAEQMKCVNTVWAMKLL